ncbi:MAG: type II secretion system protein GspN [Desulfobulbaceae bacterium]|nr:type II secretion system protein GspN [Desulfobulbaceae bacterium]
MMRSIFSFRTLFYVMYGVGLTVALLYIRFPTEKFRTYCEIKVTRTLSASNCKIGSIVYLFPLQVRFNQIQIIENTAAKPLFVLDSVDISPRGLKFWQTFSVDSQFYGGSFTSVGTVEWGEMSFKLGNIVAEGVDLASWTKELNLLKRGITGLLSFTGDYAATFNQPFSGSGQGLLNIDSGKMELSQPVLSLTEISYKAIRSKWQYKEDVLDFAEGVFDGKELKGEFSGSVTVNPYLAKSVLGLAGQLEAQTGFLKKNPKEQRLVKRLLRRYKMAVLPFKIGGTVKRPTFRFTT